MTETLSRPAAARVAPPGPRAAPPPPGSPGRPLAVSATLAGLGAALGGLLVFLAVAVTGWFLADAGAHGQTTDALRVGADAWLVGHGSQLAFGGVDYTLVPLGLTALLAWAAHRGGAWAARVSPLGPNGSELALAAALLCCTYLVVTTVTSVLAATAEVHGSLPRTLVGALLIAGLGGGSGLLSASGRWDIAARLLPGWLAPLLRAALAAVLGQLVAAAAVVVAGLVLGFGSSASLISRLDLHGGDAVMLVVLTAAVAPNAVLLGSSYLLGPGFAVGVGTSVAPASVSLGPVPSFPLLSALPDSAATTPWWTTAFLAVPALAALLGVVLVQRRHPVYAWDLALLRGVGAGLLAGLATGVLAAAGGGSVGSGRLAVVGPSLPTVVLAGALAMTLGGLVGALLMTALQRRGLLVGEQQAAPDPGDEPTVEVAPVVRQYRRDRPPPPASVRERQAQDLLQRLVRAPDTSGDDEDTIHFI